MQTKPKTATKSSNDYKANLDGQSYVKNSEECTQQLLEISKRNEDLFRSIDVTLLNLLINGTRKTI